MKSLSYNEELHEYRLDGIVVPSVTRIVQAVTGKDLSKIPAKTLKAAGDRGTAIHTDVELGTLETEEAKWIEERIDRSQCEFELQGYGQIGELVYAGTTDNIEGNILRDWKSQATPDVFGWTIQLNLYRCFDAVQTKTGAAIGMSPKDSINAIEVLHVPKTGAKKAFPIKVLSDAQMQEIASAYLEGRILDPSFIEQDRIEHEEVSLDLIVQEKNIGTLTTNAKQILASVQRKIASYSADNYSEENIAEAKRDRAELNGAAKRLNDEKIRIKKEFMKPIDEFEATIKETVSVIQTASSAIDVLVKDVEQREKDAVKARLQEFYTEQSWTKVSFDKLFKPYMTNKGTKEKDSQNEIVAMMHKIDADLILLERVNEPDAQAFYLDTLDIDAALREADRIKANRERLKRIKEEQARRQTEQARPYIAPASPVPDHVSSSFQTKTHEITSQASDTISVVATVETEERLERVMRVIGTKEQLFALMDYMDAQGIEWDKIN